MEEKRWRISFEVTATEQAVKDLGLTLPGLLPSFVVSGIKTAEGWMVEGMEDMNKHRPVSLRGASDWLPISRNKG